MHKIINFLTGRLFKFGFALFIQIVIVSMLAITLNDRYQVISFFTEILSIITVIYIVNKDENPSYKLAWSILILLLPVLGIVFYIILGNNKAEKDFIKAMKAGKLNNLIGVEDDNEATNILARSSANAKKQSEYIRKIGGFSPRQNTEVTYFPIGQDKMKALIHELKKAKYFIFMEYFIIQEGFFWDSILEILKEKASEGVDVRLMYDDAGCLNTLPKNYDKLLRSYGIKVIVFNPMNPRLDIRVNNRDHRKITVIDGFVGFNGGINLADEYINKKIKHGHWKDTAVMLKGEGVINLTQMFLQMWNYHTGETSNINDFSPFKYHPSRFFGEGIVQCFGDSPLDNEPVGETVYLNIINNAKKYVYINSPYLIIDSEMQTALITAAKSGVEVIITLPHIPDKWYVHMIAKTFYPSLLNAGVRIFEYTPGFVHAKSFVCDDEIAVVGSINLDFRSLYLHFEGATWMYKTKAIKNIKSDYINTLAISNEITLENMKHYKGVGKVVQSIIKVFSPLM